MIRSPLDASSENDGVDLIAGIVVGILLAATLMVAIGLIGLATWFCLWAWSGVVA